MVALAPRLEQGRSPLRAMGERFGKMLDWLGDAILGPVVQLDPEIIKAAGTHDYWQRMYAAGRPAPDYRYDPREPRPTAFRKIDDQGYARFETREEKGARMDQFRAQHPDANAYEAHAFEYSGVVPSSISDRELAPEVEQAYANQNPYNPNATDPRSYVVPHEVNAAPMQHEVAAVTPVPVTTGRQ